jgi:hypothetical protein
MAGWQLARMDFRGLGPHRLDVLEDQCYCHHTRRYGAYNRDSTPQDCLEARSSLLVGRQLDPSSTTRQSTTLYHMGLYTWQIVSMTISFIVNGVSRAVL